MIICSILYVFIIIYPDECIHLLYGVRIFLKIHILFALQTFYITNLRVSHIDIIVLQKLVFKLNLLHIFMRRR